MTHTFDLKNEYRTCIVDEKKALFHKWTTQKNVIEPSLMIGGHPGGEIQFTFAIVEFEDGTIHEVAPHHIRFIDHKHREYSFFEVEAQNIHDKTHICIPVEDFINLLKTSTTLKELKESLLLFPQKQEGES